MQTKTILYIIIYIILITLIGWLIYINIDANDKIDKIVSVDGIKIVNEVSSKIDDETSIILNEIKSHDRSVKNKIDEHNMNVISEIGKKIVTKVSTKRRYSKKKPKITNTGKLLKDKRTIDSVISEISQSDCVPYYPFEPFDERTIDPKNKPQDLNELERSNDLLHDKRFKHVGNPTSPLFVVTDKFIEEYKEFKAMTKDSDESIKYRLNGVEASINMKNSDERCLDGRFEGLNREISTNKESIKTNADIIFSNNQSLKGLDGEIKRLEKELDETDEDVEELYEVLKIPYETEVVLEGD